MPQCYEPEFRKKIDRLYIGRRITLMEDEYTLTLEDKESHFDELHLSICGHSVCYPDNNIGPAAHSCYVLHYILDGKGEYRIDGRTYTLEKNEGFLMMPNRVCS